MSKKLLSVIVPVYNEEEVLPISYARFSEALSKITDYDYELIYVDDGSRDRSLDLLRDFAKNDPRLRVLSFSRNFGHQLAVTAGMDIAKGDAVIIIDVDLQDPPEIIAQMVARWEAGADVVYGKRKKREGESAFKLVTAFFYYRLLSFMSSYPIPLDSGDFRLLDRAVAQQFLTMREHNRFLRGMSAWMGYTAEPLEYARAEREAGKTKYTLKKMLKLAFDGIAGFSYKPLTLPGYIGAAICTLSLLGLLALIILAAIIGVAPWLWALAGILFVQGIVLVALGLQGAYLGRMYDELKGRPLYIVRETIGTDE
ncbi:glycosyltransferase family 2 protein [Christensenellaceae bacterium OttesenSCG-928-L17]|nr:glycosyltransferase family 2 protein [Christensenellaceae bacterium OttesenSCG-928-L17]